MTAAKAESVFMLNELGRVRRYAFSLLGDRTLSDMIVRRVVNSLFGSTNRSAPVSQATLYRAINDATGAIRPFNIAPGGQVTADHSPLLGLSSINRQIVALKTICGFSLPEIANICDIALDDACARYLTSLKDLQKKPPAVLIIEDEALIALELGEIVTGLGLALAGIARNRAEAIRLANLSKPQLILADYKLQDDTGVAVVRAIRQGLKAGVIYVTAYPQAAVTGRERGDTVLSKPVDVHAVERAVQLHFAA